MKHELKLAIRMRWLEFRRLVNLPIDEGELLQLRDHFTPKEIEPLREWDE